MIILAKNYIWGANREFFPKLITFLFLWHITPNSSKLAGALQNLNLHPHTAYPYLTSDFQNSIFIGFLDPKNVRKHV